MRLRRVLLAALVVASLPIAAQRAPDTQPSTDMIARILSGEFATDLPPPPEWSRGAHSYIAVEPGEGGAPEVAEYRRGDGWPAGPDHGGAAHAGRYAHAAGRRRARMVAGQQRVLIFTNTPPGVADELARRLLAAGSSDGPSQETGR